MQFHCVVEILVSGMSSDLSSAGWKQVTQFYMFYIVKGVMRWKHVVQTADQAAQAGRKVDRRMVKQNGGLFSLNESSAVSFDFVIEIQNSLRSSKERQRQFILTLRAWICHYTGHCFMSPRWSKIKVTAFRMTWRRYLVSWAPSEGKHRLASSHGMQPENPTWLTSGCHSQVLQYLMWLRLKVQKYIDTRTFGICWPWRNKLLLVIKLANLLLACSIRRADCHWGVGWGGGIYRGRSVCWKRYQRGDYLSWWSVNRDSACEVRHVGRSTMTLLSWACATSLIFWSSIQLCRTQELCESRGGRPGPPVPNSPYGLFGCKATLENSVRAQLLCESWVGCP